MLRHDGIRGFLFVFLSFFLFELILLPHYGTDWDTINHLPRGQAYLRYIFTGEQTYKALPEYIEYYQKEDALFFSPDKPKESIPKRSIYQIDGYDASYFLKKDIGHPPLSDILSALFNVILFQNTRLINDIDSYHVYVITMASVLVAFVFSWTRKRFGNLASIVATLSLIFYPLFLGESHFNLKDIPEATFYSLTLIFFYEGLVRKRLLFIAFSAASFGFAWGTKFNILFSLFTIIPFILFQRVSFKQYKPLLPALYIFPLVSTIIFFGSWPYLWNDPVHKFFEIVNYYKTIGINTNFDKSFVHLGFNTYALQWILYTTPLVTLFFTSCGIVYALIKGLKEKEKAVLFVLLWLSIPIFRVTIPNAGIYGGVRQIMEFIPAMAILSGIGANYIAILLNGYIVKRLKQFNNSTIQQFPSKTTLLILQAICILAFLPITLKLISIHPNENVYFNPLIGGLKGAKEREIPYWGNNFGNAYRQAVAWINQNAEKGSTLVLAQELMPNLPKLLVRSDLKYGNNLRSGYIRNGEYVIGLDYGLATNRSYYSSRYYNRYLNPVYQIKVDETSILNIWINNLSHTKKGFIQEEKTTDISYKPTDRGILVDLKRPLYISKIQWSFLNFKCAPPQQIYFNVSADGNNWYKTPHVLPEDLPIPILDRQPVGNTITYPFAAEYAQYIYIIIDPENSCPKNIQSLSVFHLPEAHQR